MKNIFLRWTLLGALSLVCVESALAANDGQSLVLTDANCRLEWTRSGEGWRLQQVSVTGTGGPVSVGAPSGEYTVLFSATAPSTEPVKVPWAGHPNGFPEPIYHYQTPGWREVTSPVAMNVAGEARRFFPSIGTRVADGGLEFVHEDETARVTSSWRLDPKFPGDVRVSVTLTARKAGWYSLATPTLSSIKESELAWGVVPGVFQGAKIQSDFVLAAAYGQGLPDRPILVRERTASSLTSIATTTSGASLAVTAEPGTATDPWADDHDTRQEWRLGLSHMNRQGALAPTLYHPVLGQPGSQLAAGESRTFSFRYTLCSGDWFTVARHVIYDVYHFSESLGLRQPRQSLSNRLLAQLRYLTDAATSMWRTEEFGGQTIGAQAYLGGVVGSDRDAMKNSDYGAMWMLARLTGDERLTRDRLPFARAFKLVQQQVEPGFFQGAAIGQYYLSKSRRFTEEWGDYVEPVALTFYSMLDLGNILLFSPEDKELRERLRLGAERLMTWQHPDGHWEVAYRRADEQKLFTELSDLRPTFYGLLVAYKVLGDEKYLAAARRGADWLVEHAVNKGHFLGVCGDARFAPDFATAQVAQALLDLGELTGDVRYRDAGIAAARFYVTSIYTHPVATTKPKRVGGVPREDWEINQAGLSFEHGGLIGSANRHGPILLASHAGMFVRVHQLTGEKLFLDMARSAVVGREAFVDPKTQVASYYWDKMNLGAGPYPHHAWWQIGWITDYLLSEVALRSKGQISFPRGFFTPKVGPHACFGFAPGKLYGKAVDLGWGEVESSEPAVDTVVMRAVNEKRIYVVLLNESGAEKHVTVGPVASALTRGEAKNWTGVRWLDANATAAAVPELATAAHWTKTLPGFGLSVLELAY